ncbi:MAG TPA: alpha-glucosidase C-terminal domain-containing protein, partial [Parafilimonas sp.]|nr:alpha-glucosidase C-terminal domain-containing protein [Parafilimonas sp.]
EGEVELHGFYKTLLTIRKKNKALQESASVLLLQTDQPEVLLYLCRRQYDKVLVLMNLSKQAATFRIDHPALAGQYVDLFSGEPKTMNRKETFNFQPGEYLVCHLTH